MNNKNENIENNIKNNNNKFEIKQANYILNNNLHNKEDKRIFIENITKLINDAYEWGESDMWHFELYKRTNMEEVSNMINEDIIIDAFIESNSIDYSKPVGSVKCNTKFNEKLKEAELGMLSVSITKQGLGNLLISACETKATNDGCVILRLELLTPKNWIHPVKKWLEIWYTSDKLRFVKGEKEDFDSLYPQFDSKIKKCKFDFTVYRKKLI